VRRKTRIKFNKTFLYPLLGILLILAGFGVGKLSVPQELEKQAGILVIDPSQRLKVNVWYVIDGDTIHVIGGEKVRLIGIDAPGINETGGEEALENLPTLVEDKEVELEFDPKVELGLRDPYGRLLAYIWVKDILVNEKLVKQGLAKVVSEEIQRDFKYKSRFLEAQKYAQEKRLGIWKR